MAALVRIMVNNFFPKGIVKFTLYEIEGVGDVQVFPAVTKDIQPYSNIISGE